MISWARRPQAISHLLAIGGYLVVTVALTYPIAFYLTSHIPFAYQFPGWPEEDLDPWHSLWVLWFGSHSLIQQGHLSLSTDILFYPRGVSVAYLSLIPFPLLLSTPLVYLFGVIVAHNVLILGMLAFSGYIAFLLTDYLVQDKRVAFVAGLVYTFCPYHMVRSTVHLFLVIGTVWLPLYVLLLIKAVREGKTAHLLLAPLIFFITLLSNPYYPIFLLVFVGLCFLYYLCNPWPTTSREVLFRRFALVAVLSALPALAVVMLAIQRQWPDTLLHMPLSEARSWSADLLAFFTPSLLHSLWGTAMRPIYERFTGNVFEQTVYVGYVVLCLALVAAVTCDKRETRFWTIASLCFFILSLGPFLHIDGAYSVTIDDVTVTMPLPSLLFHFVPVIRGARAPSRFAVMLMLCLAVLVGYGLKMLLAHGKWKRGSWTQAVLLWGVSAAILLDYLSVPLPILDAKIPWPYEAISRYGRADASVADVPQKKGAAKYQYYQTAHRKKLLTGFAPRPSADLVKYAQTFPLMHLLKDPDRFLDHRQLWTRGDAMRLVDFFNLDALVIHGAYLQEQTVGPLKQYLTEIFPVRRMVTEGDLILLWMDRDDDAQSHWRPIDYRWDFNPSELLPLLFEGWSNLENWDGLTVAWADTRESRLWVYFPRATEVRMDMRVLPFTFPGSPPQAIKVYANQQFLTEVELVENVWQTHSVRLPQSSLRAGVNAIQLEYRYTASPAQVVVGSQDPRSLAVAYDAIIFHLEAPTHPPGAAARPPG